MGLEKAKIRNLTAGGDPFEVLFNPEQYTVSRRNNFAQVVVHGLSSPLLQFSNGELKTLQMDLFFDSRERHASGTVERTPANGDVRKLVDPFLALMDLDRDTHAPPVLLFQWGSLRFQCVLADASQQFTMFREDGCPVRATVTVTFQEYTNPEAVARSEKLQTADYTKVHEVVQGETLAGIAHKAYGDAALWRPIALKNELDDPRRLTPGRKLLIPRLPYRAPGGDEVFS
jgi:nucleoid-associated protein YgaU